MSIMFQNIKSLRATFVFILLLSLFVSVQFPQRADAILCRIGTTISQVGSDEECFFAGGAITHPVECLVLGPAGEEVRRTYNTAAECRDAGGDVIVDNVTTSATSVKCRFGGSSELWPSARMCYLSGGVPESDISACTGSPDAIERCLAARKNAVLNPPPPDPAKSGSENPGDLPVIPREIKSDCNDAVLNASNCGIIKYLVNGINFLSAAAGLAIVASMMIAGYQYMTARDNPGAVQAARTRIAWSVVALVLFIFMYAILNFLVPGGIL